MSKRQSWFTVPSDEVQGEGSWVKIRSMPYGVSRQIGRAFDGMSTEEKVQRNEELVVEYVVEWNWVDDDDQPLAVPKDDPAVLESLTTQEMAFLGRSLSGTDNEKK